MNINEIINQPGLQEDVITYLAEHGLKKSYLAQKLGISPAMLSLWFGRKTGFPNDRIDAIREFISK